MKSPWWPALLVAYCGLTLPGALAPATFFIKHVSDDSDTKEDFPALTTPTTPISSMSFLSHHSGGKVKTNRIPINVKSKKFESRVYPGYTYSEDFGTYPVDNSLTTSFVDEINDFHIPHNPEEFEVWRQKIPRHVRNLTPQDEGELPTQLDKSNEDYETSGYNIESGEPPDYQTFYSSGEEDTRPSHPPTEEQRDYNDEDNDSPQNYEVEEKIPDDLKYKPPKVTVFPLPPPCKGATPPPWPTFPPPPKPSPKPKPKPGGGDGGGSGGGGGVGGGGNGYYTYATYPRLSKPMRSSAKYRASAKYRSKPKTQSKVIKYAPYLIRYSNLRAGPILIRPRTLNSVRLTTRAVPYRSPATLRSSKKPTKPKEIVKEVHIHHHHNPPHPVPAIVPLITLLDENGVPVHRSGGKKGYPVAGMKPSGSDNMGTFAFPPKPSASTNAGRITFPSAPAGSASTNVGRFAEPPPHTTSGYADTDVNRSVLMSQSAVEITG